MAVGYSLLYLLLFIPLDDIFATHWYTYINGFYDSRAAKRIVPVISTGTRIAGIVAGLAMPLLNRALPPNGIVMIWLATLLGTVLLVWLPPGARVLRPMKPDRGRSTFVIARPTQRTSYFDNIREGYRFVVGSVYLRWMAISTLLLAALLTLIQYRGSQILLAELKTTADIANFIGMLNGVGNLIVLPIQLFLLSRIINRIGMGNAALIYPGSDLLGLRSAADRARAEHRHDLACRPKRLAARLAQSNRQPALQRRPAESERARARVHWWDHGAVWRADRWRAATHAR